jgi:CRISPR/Cas system-associated exonuclease Cas4 (RecB family)
MRKAFYLRKYAREMIPDCEEDAQVIFHRVRGRAVEQVITRYANLGASQVRCERDDIVGFIDILAGEEVQAGGDSSGSHDGIRGGRGGMLIEIKDTTSGKRLTLADSQFRGYLIQLLYYLVLAQKEKGIIVINYSMMELIWDHKDTDGRSWFYRPANPKKPGIECRSVYMARDDPIRQTLWFQMLRRKRVFLRALQCGGPIVLPRVREEERHFKCANCPFYKKCMNEDDEAEDARAMAEEDPNLLTAADFVRYE